MEAGTTPEVPQAAKKPTAVKTLMPGSTVKPHLAAPSPGGPVASRLRSRTRTKTISGAPRVTYTEPETSAIEETEDPPTTSHQKYEGDPNSPPIRLVSPLPPQFGEDSDDDDVFDLPSLPNNAIVEISKDPRKDSISAELDIDEPPLVLDQDDAHTGTSYSPAGPERKTLQRTPAFLESLQKSFLALDKKHQEKGFDLSEFESEEEEEEEKEESEEDEEGEEKNFGEDDPTIRTRNKRRAKKIAKLLASMENLESSLNKYLGKTPDPSPELRNLSEE
ncbi:histone H3.v1-like [Diachasma alloeum]|uniref:histone H3.v1-like n=1 Tax=Diachasma alloeum TaxID=454923 RepID=UPI0007382FFE|nr:histone H3.v1-like [Diachasma alloeum]